MNCFFGKWLREIEAVEIHDLGPGGHEVVYEFLFRIRACIDFRYGPQNGIGAEDQIGPGSYPLGFVRFAIHSSESIAARGYLLPLDIHAKQINEEVVGQLTWTIC